MGVFSCGFKSHLPHEDEREQVEGPALFLYIENHAIVAWFRRALAVYSDKKTPNVYNKNVTCQLRKIHIRRTV